MLVDARQILFANAENRLAHARELLEPIDDSEWADYYRRNRVRLALTELQTAYDLVALAVTK